MNTLKSIKEILLKKCVKKTLVWDTFLTNNEISAIHSSINLLGDKIDNTYEDEWNDEEEEQQYKETLKYLCRVVHRIYDQDGRSLRVYSYWVVKYTIESNPEKAEEIDVDLETENFDEIIGHAEDERSNSDDLISPKDIKVIQITDET